MKTLKYILITFCVINLSCKNANENGDISGTKSENTSTQKFINKNDLERIEPPNWWIGFENDTLQLLVKHENISNYSPSISYEGVSIEDVSKGDNSRNYLFIDLILSETTSAGKFNIKFRNENDEELIATYELKERKKPADDYIGFNSSDAIYLITPDRFANANTANDTPLDMEGWPELLERTIDRSNDYARHGGDIQGITNYIDYISKLGFTAIWPQPMLTNNMKSGSYHGYAITDLYEIDPRFGTLAEYQELSQKLKAKRYETYYGPSRQSLRA